MALKKRSSRPRVISTGKKPPKDGITKPNVPRKTAFQKLMEQMGRKKY